MSKYRELERAARAREAGPMMPGIDERVWVWAWGDWYPGMVVETKRTRFGVSYATRQGRRARVKQVGVKSDEWLPRHNNLRPPTPESAKARAATRAAEKQEARERALETLGQPFGLKPEEFSLQGEMTKQLLKYAAGRAVFCPKCGRVMDYRATVHVDAKKAGQWVGCGPCFDKSKLRTACERHPGRVEVADGRHYV